MVSIYFINERNESEGGYSLEQLQTKGLKPTTMVWYEGLENWTKASEVELLKPLFAKMPPPVPQPPPPVIKIATPPPIEPKAAPVVQKSQPPKKGWFGRLNWLQKIGFFLLVLIGLYAAVIGIMIISNGGSSSYNFSGGYNSGRSGWTAAENAVRENPANYVVIDKKYSTDKLFGGISDGFLAVTNRSNFMFDRVVIKVYYIKSDGGTHGTTTVIARNIPANGTVNEPFANSARGTSVRAKIEIIDCSALNIHKEYIVE